MLILSVLLAPACRADDERTPRHLTESLRLIKSLEPANNKYVFGEDRVVWSDTCEMQADCSGYLNTLFKRTKDLSNEQLKEWLGSTRPTAKRYFEAIEAGKGFTAVPLLKDARPGDVLAVHYKLNYTGKATGHVMLIAGPVEKMEAKEPVIEGATQWEVPVIDSAINAHGSTDTRYRKGEEGKDATGLGMGVLRVYVDKQGAIAGYTWSTQRKQKEDFYPQTDRPMVIGRVK